MTLLEQEILKAMSEVPTTGPAANHEGYAKAAAKIAMESIEKEVKKALEKGEDIGYTCFDERLPSGYDSEMAMQLKKVYLKENGFDRI